MLITLTPTKLCIETGKEHLNDIEREFLKTYSPAECLICHYNYKDSTFDITGKPKNLYEVLLYLSYKFDIELK